MDRIPSPSSDKLYTIRFNNDNLVISIKIFVELTDIMLVHLMNNEIGWFSQFVLKDYYCTIIPTRPASCNYMCLYTNMIRPGFYFSLLFLRPPNFILPVSK